jgi:4-methyl-5(b-hydroxyethyl)-thiazole monophosphate biosynthesis
VYLLIKRKKVKTMKIAVLIANGSEEIELITPIDILRRAGVICDVVSVNDIAVNCSRGVNIIADKLITEICVSEYDGVVIPGGMPGATNISNSEQAINFIKYLLEQGKMVSSICASPAVVLAKHGLINGKKATCFPAQEFIETLKSSGATYTANGVETDGNIITANGPKSAMEFSMQICAYLGLTPKI